MKKLKKITRLFCLALFLLLAVTGIAITGAAPTPSNSRNRPENNDTLIEMVDEKEEDEEKP
ncbi:hypothetical protein [Mucilaginibacter sp. SP1R1]|uniref:hypothetical protein n=1 Tax=Mucilaginibacter sp. SP1R1 TaxID=2723091 RepID=UPI001621F908|nr:hypothetical protein [Mucilaginibacter sp. SP1R1]MBB6149773.1 hypothetical protein [Mucilaginibacter sp. SP1R1]